MSDSTISNLPVADAISGNELVPLVQSGTTKKALVSQLQLPTFQVPISTPGLITRETGTNAKQGVSVLVAGSKVVLNTGVTATSRIFLTAQSLGTVAAPKALAVTARTAGVSFTITSSDATDTSTVAWEIFEAS